MIMTTNKEKIQEYMKSEFNFIARSQLPKEITGIIPVALEERWGSRFTSVRMKEVPDSVIKN